MTTITRDEAAKAYANGESVEVTFVWLDSGDWRNVACYGVFDDPKASFRRKPKPLECWAVANGDGRLYATTVSHHCAVTLASGGKRVVHMREVTE